MNSDDKDSIKDFIIISLIKTLAHTYSYNYNLDKHLIEKHLFRQLEQFNIFDQNIHTHLNDIIPQNTLNHDTHILIGNGAFSNVYKIYNPLDDTHYALKKIGIHAEYTQSLLEVRAMAKLTHPHIVRYHMSWIESSDIEKGLFSSSLLRNTHTSTPLSFNSFIK